MKQQMGVPGCSYVDGFGIQWSHFRRTQLDSFSGTTISRDRLFATSRWPSQLNAELILEAGSGAGRFTEVLLATGASVVSFDLSTAVWANRANNGHNTRLLLLQADVRALPFRPESFDRVLCLGVLQHCPDPRKAFENLATMVRPGGEIVVDVYDVEGKRPRTNPAYAIRRLTRRAPAGLLFTMVRLLTPPLLRMKRAVRWLSRRMRYVGLLSAWIPVFDYRDQLPLTKRQVEEWAVLDTFDFLAARYDQPQHIDDVRQWFLECGLEILHLDKGGNGIVGRGRAPTRT